MVTIDPNDDNIILGIPEDIDPATLPQEGPIKKVKIIQKHVKQSRMMLNRSGKYIYFFLLLLNFKILFITTVKGRMNFWNKSTF